MPAKRVYCEPVRPIGASAAAAGGLSLQQQHDDLLDISLVSGKRIVETALMRAITVDEGNAAAALEVMTRYAVNPKWLIHLPPTMSPAATSKREGILEHPDEAFDYYRGEGVSEVVIQEKHMGSRALIAVCRDEDAARERFGVTTGETGMVYSRTGRAFFGDAGNARSRPRPRSRGYDQGRLLGAPQHGLGADRRRDHALVGQGAVSSSASSMPQPPPRQRLAFRMRWNCLRRLPEETEAWRRSSRAIRTVPRGRTVMPRLTAAIAGRLLLSTTTASRRSTSWPWRGRCTWTKIIFGTWPSFPASQRPGTR